MIITIDGPSAVGKTTIGKKLAEELQKIKQKPFLFLDTGIVYRLIAYNYLKNIPLSTENLINQIEFNINYEEKYGFLYTEQIALLTSKISQQREIRELVTESIRIKVRILKEQNPENGFILAGRDCGTVIFPQADYKFFLYATPETRAQRRFNQYKLLNQQNIDYNNILEKIKQRDKEDSERALSPLPTIDNLPPSLILITTDNLTIEQTIDKILKIINIKCD